MIIAHSFKNIQIVNNDNPIFHESFKQEIENLWQKEVKRRGGQLFNGKIISVDNLSDTTISTHTTEYKYFYIQNKMPHLFLDYKVRPLAVSGLLECEEGMIFGLRSSVSQDKNHWELVPSGSIDRDLLHSHPDNPAQAQILEELQQEIGLGASSLTNVKPFSIIEDSSTNVFDVAVYLKSNQPFSMIEKSFITLKNREYSSLVAIPKEKLSAFVLQNKVVAASRKIIELYLSNTIEAFPSHPA